MKIRWPLSEHERHNELVWAWWDWRRSVARLWKRCALAVYEWIWPNP